MKRALLAFAPLLAGCYSFSTLSRAHTVGAGRVEAFVAPEALAIPARDEVAVRPVAEAGVRVGLTDRLDLEARATTLGGTLAAHVQLRRDPSRFGFEAMLAPGVQYTDPDKLAIELPLVLGLNVGHDDQIVLAPRVVYQARVDVPASFVFVGGSIGFAWRVARHVTFLPEASFLGQVWSEPGFTSNVAGTVGMQLALATLLDF